MSKPQDSINQIDPTKVKWKYFLLNSDGEVVSSDDPQGKKPVALLNSSTFFSNNKDDAPGLMKKNIGRILNHDITADGAVRKPNLCVAVPCRSLEEMQTYYGKAGFLDGEGNRIEDAYVELQMHDDLAKGNKKFLPHDARVQATMPPREGAEQLASAMERGFDIFTYGGGNSLGPKLELCESYFAQKFQNFDEEERKQYLENHRKVKFVGFSNGTTEAFYSRGLTEYILNFAANWAFNSRDDAAADNDVDWLEFTNRQLDRLLLSFEGEKDQEVERRFFCDAENYETLKAKCEAAVARGDKITNITCDAGQLVPASIGRLPKFADNEKLILGLEGSHRTTDGYRPHQALERAIESGAINPNQVLFISIEDIIDYDEMYSIARKNGFLPPYEEMNYKEKSRVGELLTSHNNRNSDAPLSTPQEYLDWSNAATQTEIDAVRNIAAKHNIAVINGGERRAGHTKYCVLQPSSIASLTFDDATKSVTQRAILLKDNPIQADLFAYDAPSKSKKAPVEVVEDNAELREKLKTATVAPLSQGSNQEAFAELMCSDKQEVMVGKSLDLVDCDIDQIRGKGVIVHLPMVTGYRSSSEELNTFQISQNYKAAKFVILSMKIPEAYDAPGADRDAFIQNRNDNFRRLIEDLGSTTPVFITSNSVDHANDEKDNKLCGAFRDEINLQKMCGIEAQESNVPEGVVNAKQLSQVQKTTVLTPRSNDR